MAFEDWPRLITTLNSHGIEFADPLSDQELLRIEELFSFRFPADLRDFLQTAVPVGSHFPNWHACDEKLLADWFDRPRKGVLFDVANNGFWLDEWGTCPENVSDAKDIVNKLIDDAPKLIPIYMHRMMPSEPTDVGNPVFSVHQTDIIAYGTDLADYFAHEFTFTKEEIDDWIVPQNVRKIRFWDIDRFQETRWGDDGFCVFDNSRGILP